MLGLIDRFRTAFGSAARRAHVPALGRLAYNAQHLSFLINATVMDEAARLVTRTRRPQLPHDVIQLLSRRRAELHRRDLANVDAGA